MTIKLALSTAKIINNRFSKFTLAAAAQELGVPMQLGGNIFQAMIDAGKAPDFVEAVRLVAAHLEEGSTEEDPE